jgi:hypothetical protein
MTSSPQHRWSHDQLVELLDDEDIGQVKKKLDMTSSGNTVNDANAFKVATAALSDTTLLQEIMVLKTNTLQMLRDVFAFLITSGT